MSGRRSLHDLNGNGIPDSMEKNHGLSDLNGNGINDKAERQAKRDLNNSGLQGQQGFQGQQFQGQQQGFQGQQFQGQQGLQGQQYGQSGWQGQQQGFQGTQYTTATQVLLPTQVIEKPAAIHEEIRREQVEEIQPIINVEKLKTEIIQKTQPLIDREVRPVILTQTTLPTETLPTIQQSDTGLRAAQDISSVVYRDSAALIIEKPALRTEIEKVQIIEEIQPVIYKETIVPSLIKETKPVYQTINEGTVYVQQTLPVQQLRGSAWSGRSWASNDLNGNGIPDQFEGQQGFQGQQFQGQQGQQFQGQQGLNNSGFQGQQGQQGFQGQQGLNNSGFQGQQGLNNSGFQGQQFQGQQGLNQDLNGNGIPDKLEQQNNYNQNSSYNNVTSL